MQTVLDIINNDALLFMLINERKDENAKIHLHTLCGKLSMALQLSLISLEEYEKNLINLFKQYEDLKP